MEGTVPDLREVLEQPIEETIIKADKDNKKENE